MAKLTNKNANGTSFHDVTIKTSANKLISVLGEPHWVNNTGEDKVNFEFIFETEEGDVFTIYDWKHYRSLDLDEIIEWHIGSHSRMISWDALDEITKELSN
jgi:hypothetical protein